MKTKSSKFTPESVLPRFHTGAASGTIGPGQLALDVGLNPHGAWLTAYMLRRFGPPLCGCDDYKNLCQWSLTTPMPGVWLSVTPYLGDDGTVRYEGGHSLSFGYRFDKKTTKALDTPPKKEAARWKHYHERVMRWAQREGVCYCWKDTPEEQPPADFRPVSKYANKFEHSSKENPILVWSPEGGPKLSLTYLKKLWWSDGFHEAYDAAHNKKGPRYPRGSKAMKIRVQAAIKATLRDLLRPVFVRDLCITAYGKLEDDAPSAGPVADRHPHAGNGMQWAVPEPKAKKGPKP